MSQVQRIEIGVPLREGAVAGNLGEWTRLLTDAVVASCEALGWLAAAKGHRLDLLPKPGQEYLGIDVMAFPPAGRSSPARMSPVTAT